MENNLKIYNVKNIPCFLDNIEKNYFLTEIKKADIIITQPINSNYRDTDYLHTEFILENCRKTTKVIIFPSLYFDFYYIDLVYKSINNEILKIPSDYHYNNLIECYKNKLDKQSFIENYVNNIDYKNIDELEKIANDSLKELEKRENEMKKYNTIIITVSGYIRENYKKKLLFYSMNHPTKYLLQFISIKILNELYVNNITINLDIDPLYSSDRGILYKCIQKIIEFNINNYTPQLCKHNTNDINKIVDIYYDTYDKNNISWN